MKVTLVKVTPFVLSCAGAGLISLEFGWQAALGLWLLVGAISVQVEAK